MDDTLKAAVDVHRVRAASHAHKPDRIDPQTIIILLLAEIAGVGPAPVAKKPKKPADAPKEKA